MKKLNIQNILVPVDFSELSIRALATAQHLARHSGATIHLIHVHEYYYPVGFMSPGAPVPMAMVTFHDDSRRAAEEKLRELASNNSISPAHCYIAEQPPIFNEICQAAKTIAADLIVMPTHGHRGFKHLALGSTAERVVQHAPCPVFVVKQRHAAADRAGRIDKILVPVDFSVCSLEGLNYAVQFADKVAAKIFVFHSLYLGYAFTADGFAMYNLAPVAERAFRNAENEMKRFVRRAKFGGVKFETAVRTGNPVDDICTVAEQRRADLIVTSTHGRTGFDHAVMGSTAEQVVRRAPCSVLVVPSHPQVRVQQLVGKTQRRTTKQLRTIRPWRLDERLSRTLRNVKLHPFPERRRTNKFRETHRTTGAR